jgi:hypothetical protein
MLLHSALVRIDVSEERIASIIRVTRIGELGTTLAIIVFLHSVLQLLVTADVPNSLIIFILKMEAIRSSETSVLTRATRRKIPEDSILRLWYCHTAHYICMSSRFTLFWLYILLEEWVYHTREHSEVIPNFATIVTCEQIWLLSWFNKLIDRCFVGDAVTVQIWDYHCCEY